MALFFVERIKEQFGKDKEAVALYEQMTGKKVSQLYADAFRGKKKKKGLLGRLFGKK